MMKQKNKYIFAACAPIVLGFVIYVAAPTENDRARSANPAETTTAKLFDHMVEKFSFLENSIIDKRTIINGIKVPPVPNKAQNDATIAGVDIGGPDGVPNGIRDDIDRMIAWRWGNDTKKFAAAQEYEKAFQSVMVSPTRDNQIAFMVASACTDSSATSNDIEYAVGNTKERRKAIIAGLMSIPVRGCEQVNHLRSQR